MTVVDLTGGATMLVLAALLAFISRHHRVYDRYGQEALLAAASALATIGTVRLFIVADMLSSEDARTINSISVAAYLTVLAQVMWLRHKTCQMQRKRTIGGSR